MTSKLSSISNDRRRIRRQAALLAACLLACGAHAPTFAQTGAKTPASLEPSQPAGQPAGAEATPAHRPSFRDERRWQGEKPKAPEALETGGPATAQPVPHAAQPAPKSSGSDSRQVVLRMRGGDLQVTGELRAAHGGKYVIETAESGRLTLPAQRFECVGAACTLPILSASWAADALDPRRPEAIAIRGSDAIAAHLLPALIRGYASAIGAQATHVAGTSGGEDRYRLSDTKGAELAVITVQPASTEAALAGVSDASVAIAMTDRKATDAEIGALAKAEQPGSDAAVVRRAAPHEQPLATEGLAVIVAPDHPAASLSLDTIAKIFSGQITDWYELGFAPARIKVYARPGASGAGARFDELVLRPRGLQPVAAAVTSAQSDTALADGVAADRSGIALVALSAVRGAKALPLESTCGIVHRPTSFAVKADNYPLSQPLYLYAASPARQLVARGLLGYAASAEGLHAIAASQPASTAIEALPLEAQTDRMASALNAPPEAFDLPAMRALLADLKGGRRLSITLRYVPGTLDLDAPSRQAVTQLAGVLQTPEYAGKRVLLAGFTDANGRFQANVNHAFKRATQVRTAVLAAGGKALDQRLLVAKGYGPLVPLACNDTAEGQRVNRRVEVWIRD